MSKITVIVPVYNVERYIGKCVDSLLKQDYNDFEVLLIDDGSTDLSSKICDDFANKYKNVSVYHKKNGGLSDARNYGIKRATGDYLSFVDSDDVVKEDFLSFLYNNIVKYDVDISACGFCHLYENGKTNNINFKEIAKKYNRNEAQKYLNVIGYFNVSVCNKLFNRNLFEDIRFPKGKKSEDWFIMYKLIDKAGGLYYDSDVKYLYRQRAGSITKSQNINTDSIEAAKEIYDYFKNERDILPYAAQALAFSIIGVYNAILCKDESKMLIKKYRNSVLQLRREITYNELSIKRKFQLFLFFNCIHVYNIIFKIFNFKRSRSIL